MESVIHKKVKFKDQIYWYHTTAYGVNLSPLHHYDEGGDLLANPFHDVSFAVIEDGKIMRYGEQIGSTSELEDV